jgi:hypothetical protein
MSVEKVILSIIENFKPIDIDWAAKRNVDLVLLIEYNLQKSLIDQIKNIATMYYEDINNISTENVLVWLKSERPDLFNAILSSKQNLKWFDRQVNNMKVWLCQSQ